MTFAFYLSPYTDSYEGFLKGAYAKINPLHYRSIGMTQFGNEIIDESVQMTCMTLSRRSYRAA